jgi:hypothetical protein
MSDWCCDRLEESNLSRVNDDGAIEFAKNSNLDTDPRSPVVSDYDWAILVACPYCGTKTHYFDDSEDAEEAAYRRGHEDKKSEHDRTLAALDAEVDRLAGEVARLTQERDDARCWHPPVNPDRRACAGCVGPGGVAALVAKLEEAHREVARLQVCMRAPLFASGMLGLGDTSRTPNERAYEALMAERERRKRAGTEMGRVLRWQRTLIDNFKKQRLLLIDRIETAQADARNCRVVGEAHKREATRLAANEAPLRAGYVEACAERDRLREQVAKGVAPVPDASAAVESLRRSHQRAVADAESYRGQARHLTEQVASVHELLGSTERPRVIVKRLRRLLP